MKNHESLGAVTHTHTHDIFMEKKWKNSNAMVESVYSTERAEFSEIGFIFDAKNINIKRIGYVEEIKNFF